MELKIQEVSQSFCEQFQSRSRQKHYLNYFDQMSSGCSDALKGVYAQSQNPDGGGLHVLQAISEGVKHPALFRLVRENVLLRSAMALAKARNEEEKANRIEAILEDFHIALDAYMLGIPLEAATARREAKLHAGAEKACTRILRENFSMEDVDFADISQFKSIIRPLLKRLHQPRPSQEKMSAGA